MAESIPVAYKGTDPYIFISYAHKDSDIVLPIISRLQKDGYRVWYDEGIAPGSNSAIHMKARIACGIPGAGKKEEDLTPEERDIIEPLEHRRWNTYMRSEGYVYSGSPNKSSRNDLAKMHHDLVDFESLTEEDKRKDSSVGTF